VGMFGFFKKKQDVHLSPEVRGSVKLDGEPVVGLVVSRELAYLREYEKTEITQTDQQGRFCFPEKSINSVKPGSLLHQPSLLNVIRVIYEDREYQLWWDVHGSIKAAQGKSKKLLGLNCDLNDSLNVIDFDNVEYPAWPHSIKSICRW